MKSKEKMRIIFAVIIIAVLIGIYIGYHIYLNQSIAYASSENTTSYVPRISKAEKVDLESIILNNQKNIEEQIITEEIDLEYITEYRNNKELPNGTIQVVQEGRIGRQQVTIRRTYDENNEMHEEQISSIITKAAVNKIVEIGTSNSKYTYKIAKGSNIYVTSDRADIMRENSIQSEKVTTISKNTEMKVLEVAGDWYRVSASGQTGWIKSENVTGINPNATYEDKNNNNIIGKCSFDMALNKPSGLSLEQFKKVLNDSKDVNNIFRDNAEYFYYIEKQYNINGLFVASIGIHESAWGTSKISKNKKNLFGYGAYDSSPYSSSYNFSTYAEGIDLIARVLVKYYLNPKGTPIYGGEVASGKYYSGNTVSAVNKRYATDKNWANKVYKYMEYLYKKVGNN
ncbi:MAG: SH3 domain-containing protein [Clostridia bacterium]|nr:SH3 domain-containing protein [Clostridia bacterium]